MKICAISDTHTYHRKLKIPEADVLVITGDLTFRGEMDVIEDLSKWLAELPHKHKVLIAGNHDWCFEQRDYRREAAIQMIMDSNTHYLENSSVEIDGLHFYGSPATPFFCNWAFNYQRGPEIATIWNKIPTSVNVLLTHGPPFGYLDLTSGDFGPPENVGCKDLLVKIESLPNLKTHCFGHIHRNNNEQPILRNGVQFCNASVLNSKYEVANDPILIDIS